MTVSEYNDIVRSYADNVYRFILKNVRDEEKARDIVQDAFEKMWKKVDKIDYAKGKSYLFTTAYRTFIDSYRKGKKMGSWEEADEPRQDATQAHPDLSDILQKALQRLSDVQRSVVMLRDYEGYEYQEISEITGLSLSQVKVYIFRARKSLKEYLVSVDHII